MLIYFLCLVFGLSAQAASPATDAPPPTHAKVVKVYDGDTITLDSGDRVRLRFVNTPELNPAQDYGIEARDTAKELVLEQEVQLSYGEVKRDGYGRLLASIEARGKDLATLLLERGYAHLFIIPPHEHDDAPLLTAQARARRANRGIWSTDSYKGRLHITSFHANARGNDRENINGEYARVCNVTEVPINLEGYRVTELAGRAWVLPAMELPPGHTVKIHSGVGDNQLDPKAQLKLYLGNDWPIWNNTRDRITLYDTQGLMLDTWLYAPKSRQ